MGNEAERSRCPTALPGRLSFRRPPPTGPGCAHALAAALETCRELHCPVSDAKVEGPSTRLVFLGILIDTVAGELRLPEAKLCRLRTLLARWHCKRSCRKRDLLSLIGFLQHAATVVRPGRIFLRRMIDLSCAVRRPHHRLRLTASFRSDLRWWSEFVVRWNGISLFPPASSTVVVTSDASGSWGCGAFSGRDWFHRQWPSTWIPTAIAAKEMVPVVISAAIWGRYWSGTRVTFRCDNMAVVSVLRTDPMLMHLLRCLHFYAAYFDFQFTASHIQGKLNRAADALSRDRVSEFFSLIPQAELRMSPIPHQLEEMLLYSQLDWTSHHWIQLFSGSLDLA